MFVSVLLSRLWSFQMAVRFSPFPGDEKCQEALCACSPACSQSIGPCLSRFLRLAAPLVWRNVRTAVVPGSARLHNRAVNGSLTL